MTIILFALAIPLLGYSAERFIHHVLSLSRALKIPMYGIAAGLISVLTSIPEAIVSLSAVWKGQSLMAYGNIWGSVVANSTMVIAGAALYKPVSCRKLITHKEMPLLILVNLTWAVFLTLSLPLLPLLVISPLVWLVYMKWAHSHDHVEEVGDVQSWGRDLMWAAGYFFLIWLASEWLISGALLCADYFDVSKWVVGLTILAIGTSLPELVVSLSAQMQGLEDVTLGNVIGSNLFLILVLIPACSLFHGAALPSSMLASVWMVLGVNAILWLFTLFFDQHKRINRIEACLLLLLFAGFMMSQW